VSDFWSRQLGVPAAPRPAQPAAPRQQQPAAPRQQQRAWWQEPEPEPQYQPPQQGYQNQALQAQMPYGGATGGAGMPEGEYVRQLRRLSSDELTGEQMEMIAAYELSHDAKHQQSCPQCGSGNFVLAGTRSPIGGGTTSTDKCFDCNYSARGPMPALGGRSNGRAAERHARQIDTGGGAGSMYLASRHLPGHYAPSA
jgi:hypothetical protein